MTITEKLAKLDADELAVRRKFNPGHDPKKVHYVYLAGIGAGEIIKKRVASDPITIRDKRTMWEKFRALR